MSVVSFRFTFLFGDRLEAVTADHAVSFVGVNGTWKTGVGSFDTGDTIISVTLLPVVVYFLNVVALATVEVISPLRAFFLPADHGCSPPFVLRFISQMIFGPNGYFSGISRGRLGTDHPFDLPSVIPTCLNPAARKLAPDSDGSV